MNGPDTNKVLDMMRWVIFDTTPLKEEDRQDVGFALRMFAKLLEPIYDKYNKEKVNDNNQTEAK